MTDINKNLLENDSFHFFIPVSLTKSRSDDEKDNKRWIQGIASTFDKDLQNEKVRQKGIDYGYFLKQGYINDDHKSGPEHIVGEPVECRLTQGGLWIKAFLYKGKPRADYWWEHLNALQQSDSNRKVGFSIQGKITRRNGNVIEKCWLQDVAITSSPVNTNTWAEIVKSLSAQEWCIHPWDDSCPGGCCDCNAIKSTSVKDEEKSLSTDNAELIPESLEDDVKIQTYKSITFKEAVDFLCKEKGYSKLKAKVIADSIFTSNGLC